MILVIGLFVFLLASFALVVRFNERFLVLVPQRGGALAEGIIGRPRFINPVIAKSDADRDMSALIYSGLLRATPEGTLIPDLAREYSVSTDGLTYTFTLRDDLVWHDGEPITSADVAFTIDKVRDPGLAIKSPRRASWDGVEVTVPDAKTIVFRIKQPYAPFLENATMGIIPKHIWQNVPNEEFDVAYYNIEPIGSGPYRMDQIIEDKAKGLPQAYELIAFKRYALGEPYITHLRIAFFGNNKELAQAYNDRTVEQMTSIEPALAQTLTQAGEHIITTPLPRIFAAFFNQNQQPIFTDKAVRQALALAVDKEEIVREVLFGYGKTINGPLPSLSEATTTEQLIGSVGDRIATARALLEKAGWTLGTDGVYQEIDKKKKTTTLLQFSIAIPDVPELKTAAELLKQNWEKLGAAVTLKVFDQSTFAAEVLSPRKYDVLFYGEVEGRMPDPFAYWHSSQRNAPGLNIALYANKNVDKFLEDARKESDPGARSALLTKFVTEIAQDVPAIFIYAPDFLYATGAHVGGIEIGRLTTESERFLNVRNWYVNSAHVWKWFTRQ
jgi:peptide/nickel transport system substrate-binding protein